MRALLAALCLSLGACATMGPRTTDSAMVSGNFCTQNQLFDARQQDRMLRFAATARDELNEAGADIALISRSGLDLDRLGVIYSHSGIGLRQAGEDRWDVRQLYYACDEGRPRLYDQGLTGFMFGTDKANGARLSIVWLPAQQAQQLHRAAADKTRALRLLAATYSANAYPFSTRYQNCNQWVAEMLAAAFGDLPDDEDLRARAQQWLLRNGYQPDPLELDSYLLKTVASMSPLIHLDDHPEQLRSGLKFQLSLPRSIETFVRQRMPQAQRVELCHDDNRIVIRRGWTPLDAHCTAGPADRLIALN